MYRTLITPQELKAILDSTVLVDCRFDLTNPRAGEQAYAAGHLPSAVYASLDRDLSSEITPTTGRHPLPDPQRLADTFGRWGIDEGRQVVAYDADAGAYAARLWWLLRWLGHDSVAVLSGGFNAWQTAGLPVNTAVATPTPAKFAAHVRPNAFVTAEQVAALVQQPNWRVLDARGPERFSGQVEPIDPVAGHIPGACNFPFVRNLGADACVLPAGELAVRYRDALGATAPDHVVAMCGSGVTACHLLLAMEHAGLTGATLYAGSWSEWIRDPNRPIAP